MNWATLPPELSDLAPLRDLRRSQRLRDKRKELKNQTNGSSSDGSLNGTENTTINSSTASGPGDTIETTTNTIIKSSTPPTTNGVNNGGMMNDYLLPGAIDALCNQMQETLNHDVDCTPKNQLRV